MPELPEVETIRRGLAKVIVGRKIVKFESRDAKVVRFDEKDITGLKIEGIDRKAKMLVFELNGDKAILIHLKMTGQLIWEACPGETEFCLKKMKSPSTPFDTAQGGSLRANQRLAGGHPSPDWVAKLPNKHTRAIFSFDDKSVLFFNDVRRFGYLKLYKKSDLGHISELKKLGPEPFSKEFNTEYLIKRAERIPNRKIKQFIIDQEIISGVGNIYVDEALFYAGILPTRAVKDISKTEWQKIVKSIKKALELGLKYGGSSEDTYVDAFGNPGTMNDHTKVYRKKGQPCGKCGTKVERIVLGGRGTHFCPKCQK